MNATEQWQEVLLRLRVERETSPWWSTGPHPDDLRDADAPPYEPTPGSLWDDSETNCARRRGLLNRATERMDHHYREDAV